MTITITYIVRRLQSAVARSRVDHVTLSQEQMLQMFQGLRRQILNAAARNRRQLVVPKVRRLKYADNVGGNVVVHV